VEVKTDATLKTLHPFTSSFTLRGNAPVPQPHGPLSLGRRTVLAHAVLKRTLARRVEADPEPILPVSVYCAYATPTRLRNPHSVHLGASGMLPLAAHCSIRIRTSSGAGNDGGWSRRLFTAVGVRETPSDGNGRHKIAGRRSGRGRRPDWRERSGCACNAQCGVSLCCASEPTELAERCAESPNAPAC